MKVAVLSGGAYGEREISLLSGNAVLGALQALGHDSALVEFDADAPDRLRALAPDLVFPTLHGPLGEDGTAAAILELLGLRYVGSGVLAGALAMNKAAAKRVMLSEGVPTPAFEVVSRGESTPIDYRGAPATADRLIARLGLPLAIKPNSGGSTLGYSVARTDDDVLDGIDLALEHAGPDRTVLVEALTAGTEITVGVLGVRPPQALPSIEITYRAGNYDYAAKYTPGLSQHIIPARLPEHQLGRASETAVRVHELIGARGLSRVDMICPPSGEVWVLEINTLPGLTELSLFPDAARAAGLEFPQLIARLVQDAGG